MRRLLALAGLISLISWGGCGDDDDGLLADAGRGRDRMDAGPDPRDAGSRDAGARDGGRDAGQELREPPAVCPEGDCDVRDASTCGSGETCVYVNRDGGPNGPTCMQAGSAEEGTVCERTSDCAPGLDCALEPDAGGRCRHYCCALSQTEGCPEGQFCRLSIADLGTSSVGLCDECNDCDPREPSSCGAGLACYPLPGERACTACFAEGSMKAGSACTYTTECAPGTACFRVEGDRSRCIAFCDFDGDKRCEDEARKCMDGRSARLPPGLGLCL